MQPCLLGETLEIKKTQHQTPALLFFMVCMWIEHTSPVVVCGVCVCEQSTIHLLLFIVCLCVTRKNTRVLLFDDDGVCVCVLELNTQANSDLLIYSIA